MLSQLSASWTSGLSLEQEWVVWHGVDPVSGPTLSVSLGQSRAGDPDASS